MAAFEDTGGRIGGHPGEVRRPGARATAEGPREVLRVPGEGERAGECGGLARQGLLCVGRGLPGSAFRATIMDFRDGESVIGCFVQSY